MWGQKVYILGSFNATHHATLLQLFPVNHLLFSSSSPAALLICSINTHNTAVWQPSVSYPEHPSSTHTHTHTHTCTHTYLNSQLLLPHICLLGAVLLPLLPESSRAHMLTALWVSLAKILPIQWISYWIQTTSVPKSSEERWQRPWHLDRSPPCCCRVESDAAGLVSARGRQLWTDRDRGSQGPTLCPNLHTPSPDPEVGGTWGQHLHKIRNNYDPVWPLLTHLKGKNSTSSYNQSRSKHFEFHVWVPTHGPWVVYTRWGSVLRVLLPFCLFSSLFPPHCVTLFCVTVHGTNSDSSSLVTGGSHADKQAFLTPSHISGGFERNRGGFTLKNRIMNERGMLLVCMHLCVWKRKKKVCVNRKLCITV